MLCRSCAKKVGESHLFRGRESFLSAVYSGSSLTWDWLVAYAEKKGLALQLRKIEMLLSKRKKKIERSGLCRLRGLRLEFSSFRVFVLLPGSLIWLWLWCYERLIPLVFPILLYLKCRLVSLPICTASGGYSSNLGPFGSDFLSPLYLLIFHFCHRYCLNVEL